MSALGASQLERMIALKSSMEKEINELESKLAATRVKLERVNSEIVEFRNEYLTSPSIKVLNLDSRISKALKHGGVNTVYAAKVYARENRWVKGLGDKAWNRIRAAIADYESSTKQAVQS